MQNKLKIFYKANIIACLVSRGKKSQETWYDDVRSACKISRIAIEQRIAMSHACVNFNGNRRRNNCAVSYADFKADEAEVSVYISIFFRELQLSVTHYLDAFIRTADRKEFALRTYFAGSDVVTFAREKPLPTVYRQKMFSHDAIAA